MKTINALSARSRLGTILNEVSQEGVHYIIERLSKRLVVVVPFKEYQELYKSKGTKQAGEEFLQELSRFRKKYGRQFAGKKGTLHLLHEIRNERAKQLEDLQKQGI